MILGENVCKSMWVNLFKGNYELFPLVLSFFNSFIICIFILFFLRLCQFNQKICFDGEKISHSVVFPYMEFLSSSSIVFPEFHKLYEPCEFEKVSLNTISCTYREGRRANTLLFEMGEITTYPTTNKSF